MRVVVYQEIQKIMVDDAWRDATFTLPEGCRVLHWDSESVVGGWYERIDQTQGNIIITEAEFDTEVQPYIDLWTAAAPVVIPQTAEEIIAAAKVRARIAYQFQIRMWSEYEPSWLDQDATLWPLYEECVAYEADNLAVVPKMESFIAITGMSKAFLSAQVIAAGDVHLEGVPITRARLYNLLTAIDALGPTITQEQVDALPEWSFLEGDD